MSLFCSEPTALAIAATRGNDLREGGHPVLVTRISDGLIWTRLDRGDHAITGALMPTETITALRKKLETLRQSCSRQAPAGPVERLPADLATLQPVATQKVEGAVTRIVPGPVRDGLPSVHVVCDDRRSLRPRIRLRPMAPRSRLRRGRADAHCARTGSDTASICRSRREADAFG